MSRTRRLLLAVAAALLAALLIVPVAGAQPATTNSVTPQSFIHQESVTFNLDQNGIPIGEIVTQETFIGNVSYGSWELTINGLGQVASGHLLANHRPDGLTAYLTMSTPELGFATLSFSVNPITETGTGSFDYWALVNGSLQKGSESFSATETGEHQFSVSFSQIPPIFSF